MNKKPLAKGILLLLFAPRQKVRKMMDWWYGGSTLNVRVRNAKVVADGSTGDTTIETGPALLASLNNSREKTLFI
jgi:hypothetical protein